MYGQTIKSSFEIKEAMPMEKQEEVDLFVEEAEPPQFILDDIEKGYYDQITEQKMWFYIKDSFLFYIEEGRYIRISNMGNNPNYILRNCYLTGLAMAVALTQKKFVPLHGSVLEKSGSALVLTGMSGSGKSSTTLELMKRGYRFMSDDLAVVEPDDMLVFPGFPMQRLCRDAVSREGLDFNELIYLGERKDKFGCLLEPTKYLDQPRKIKAVILLKVGNQLQVEKVKGIRKVELLVQNTFCGVIYEKAGISKEMLKKYFKLAGEIEVFEVTRPQSGDTLNQVVVEVEKIMLQSCKNLTKI